MTSVVSTLRSNDGTAIAYERSGSGPPIILVVGAFNERPTGAPLAASLDQDFTVFNYDRRGRGASGDTAPYAVEREIEDLAALIDVAGGSACVFGYSSGAVLSLQAAARGGRLPGWRCTSRRSTSGAGRASRPWTTRPSLPS